MKILFCTPFHGRSYLLSYLSRGVLWYGVGGIGFGLVWLWVIWFPPIGLDLRDVSVLMLEDDAAVLDAMRQQLEGWGCRVLAATSVADACTPAPSPPDLIVADYHLGDGVTGIEAISAIRRQLGAVVPALLVTGTGSPAALREARATGCPVLRKPVAPAKLRAALAHLVRRKPCVPVSAGTAGSRSSSVP